MDTDGVTLQKIHTSQSVRTAATSYNIWNLLDNVWHQALVESSNPFIPVLLYRPLQIWQIQHIQYTVCHTPVCPAHGIKSALKLALLVLQWIVCSHTIIINSEQSIHHYKLRTEEHVNIHLSSNVYCDCPSNIWCSLIHLPLFYANIPVVWPEPLGMGRLWLLLQPCWQLPWSSMQYSPVKYIEFHIVYQAIHSISSSLDVSLQQLTTWSYNKADSIHIQNT